MVTDNSKIAERVRHLANQAKVTDQFRSTYDAVGYNYRMPALNAALGLAQWEHIERVLNEKKKLVEAYRAFFAHRSETLLAAPVDTAPVDTDPGNTISNYWLNALLFASEAERDEFVQYTNQQAIYTRPAWTLLHRLPMFASEHHGKVDQAEWAEKHVANLPSSIRYEQ